MKGPTLKSVFCDRHRTLLVALCAMLWIAFACQKKESAAQDLVAEIDEISLDVLSEEYTTEEVAQDPGHVARRDVKNVETDIVEVRERDLVEEGYFPIRDVINVQRDMHQDFPSRDAFGGGR